MFNKALTDVKVILYTSIIGSSVKILPSNSSTNSQGEVLRSRAKIIYLHRNPELHPRTNKIRQSLIRDGFTFEVFRPRFVINSRSRVLSSIFNYSCFFLQSLFIKGDIVWVANCPDIIGLGPWLSSMNYIYDYRSPWSKEVELEFGKGAFSRLAGIIERRVRSKAKAVVIVSSRMHKDVEHLGKPIFLIPNYPTRSFTASKDRDTMRKLYGLGPEKQIVLFVGKLSKVEGADMLHGIAEGLQRSSDVTLWIVGDGPLKTDIEDLQQKYPDNVHYFGWVDYAEVPNYIIAADVCIVPRHKSTFSDYYNEQGVQKIAEYLAFGKLIVACNIAKSDNNYTLVDEDSIVEGILKVLARKTPLGERRYWEEYSEPVLIEAINKLLSGSEENSSSEILKYS